MGSASTHPDFIITVNGQDFTSETLHWKISMKEQSSSQIQVTIDNRELIHSGMFVAGCPLSIRFGLWNNLYPAITMRLLKYGELGHSGMHEIELVGLDALEKLSRKQGRGHSAGTSMAPVIADIKANTGVTVNSDGLSDPGKQAGTSACARTNRPSGYTDEQWLVINGQKRAPEAGWREDDYPQLASPNTEPKDTGDAANAEIASGVNPAGSWDQNRLSNARAHARTTMITLHLTTVGYPIIAHLNYVVAGLGSMASGMWHCTDSDIAWSNNGKMLCEAKFIKGKLSASNDPSGSNPVVQYAEIFQPDTIYIGPRKINQGSTGTITYGDASCIIDYHFGIDIHSPKNAAAQVTGNALDPNKANNPKVTINSVDQNSDDSTEKSWRED